MKNALTIDLEDYFHVTALQDRVSAQEWARRASRVEANTAKILQQLSETTQQATFFVLGWVAEKHPQLIRAIAGLGHEIACHSLRHRVVYQMSPEEFRDDTRRAKELLEDASGKPVRGYRAPSFSITRDSLWAFEILAELGFTYDSSIFPIRHINYGMPDGPRFLFRVDTRFGPILEFPMTTLQLGRARSPIAGGAYLRLLPYWYTRWGMRYLNTQELQPVCVYVHPWEFDPDQPRIDASLSARLRHYLGLRSMGRKLHLLLRDFEFCPLGSLIEQLQADAPPPFEKF